MESIRTRRRLRPLRNPRVPHGEEDMQRMRNRLLGLAYVIVTETGDAAGDDHSAVIINVAELLDASPCTLCGGSGENLLYYSLHQCT